METFRLEQAEEKSLIAEIFSVTETIQKKYPQVYVLLTETPLFLSTSTSGINKEDFKQYLDSIYFLLATFEGIKQK